MTDKEAMAMALDALNKLTDVFLDTEGSYGNYETNAIDQGYEAITALKEALAQPEQEPVAWIHIDPEKPKVRFLEWKENEQGYRGKWIKKPLYTHPPQRTEQNFCPRCGKRTPDAITIHTCTPPQENT